MSRRGLRALALASGCAVVASGCGGDEGRDQADVRESAAGYLQAYAASDPDLCSLVSEAERARIGLEPGDDPDGDCEARLDRRDPPIRAEEIAQEAGMIEESTVEIDGDNAALVPDPVRRRPGFSAIYLVDEDGEWRIDDAVF